MDLPKPPEEPELKNIIDKLANFVARNGPEFENMTKQKQQDNPRFSFLFGGEHYNYYQYKVQTEQAIINVQNKKLHEQQQQQHQQQQHQQQQQQIQLPPVQQAQPMGLVPMTVPPAVVSVNPAIPPPQVVTPWPSSATPPPSTVIPIPQAGAPLQAPPIQTTQQTPQQQQVSQIQQQISLLQTQIQQQTVSNDQQVKQSEQNLAAQYQSFMQQQQVQIEEAIYNNQSDHLNQLSEECDLKVEEMDKMVKPIIDSCTKDAILSGKSWIFQHSTGDQQSLLVSQYLLKRILAKEASFELRLHLIYLVNDLLHHCQRKNTGNLKTYLEKIVVPVFCTALVGAGEDKKVKLNKLLTLWGQNKYFDPDTIEKMKDPDQSLSNYHADLITENGPLVAQISAATQLQYQGLQKQHNDFSSHLQAQLQALQTQLSQLQTQLAQAQAAVITQSIAPSVAVTNPPIDAHPPTSLIKQEPDNTQYQQPPSFSQPPPFGAPPPPFNRPPAPMPPAPFEFPGGSWQGPPPPTSAPGPAGFPLPDFSKPPPGFPPPGIPRLPPPNIDLTPSVPYYELPAGLMAPLVKLEDHDYRPLDPKDIRLPPPMPPSERLLAAVEAFYSPPFHDRPRDSEGWEKLGLYEFFKAKQKAKRMVEQRGRSRSRSQSRSFSRSRSRSRSSSSSGSPQRVATPPRRRRYRSRESRSRSRSKSKSKSRSPLPYKRESLTPSPPPSFKHTRQQRSRTRSKSRSRSRSATPPNFSTEAFLAAAAAANTTDKLGEENKGHMLLKKMGWGGRGLGAKEQGIVDPIEASDVRDRSDKYKGVGVEMNDPFEQFRKNKAQGFITRMQAREDSSKVTKSEKKRRDRDTS